LKFPFKSSKKEYLEGYTNIWAPELHEYKGKYYLIFSVFKEEKGRGSIIFVSDDLYSYILRGILFSPSRIFRGNFQDLPIRIK